MADSPHSSSKLSSNREGKKRRSSVISVASNLNKEDLTQALDSIHSTASKTQSFTAFNEFTVPPAVTSAKDGLGSITEDIQDSISGFYSRLKESVGSTKPTSRLDEVGDNDSHASSSYKAIPTTPGQRLASGAKRNSSPAPSQLSVTLEQRAAPKESPSLRPSKTLAGNDDLPDSPASQVDARPLDRNSKQSMASSVGTIRDALPADVASKSSRKQQDSDKEVSTSAVAARNSQSKPRPGDARINGTTLVLNEEAGEQNHIRESSTSRLLEDSERVPQSSKQYSSTTRPSQLSVSEPKPQESKQRSTSQNQQKATAQQRQQFLGLTRALSSTSSTVASTSTSVINEEAEEALSSVGHLPHRSAKSSTTQSAANVLSQIGNKLLGKEYWMRDENAKDCFYCGDAFSTFRRKHHCRICGQIFDSKCTTLVSGAPFGQTTSIRVCKPCEGILHGYDDSSEFSDDGSIASGFRPMTGTNQVTDLSPARSFTSLKQAKTEARHESIPSMAIPTRRLTEDSKRTSTILEIDAEPKRPSSSRSLKPSLLHRSHTAGHRRLHSKHSLKLPPRLLDASPVFLNSEKPDPPQRPRLPAFHSDNIIDPDLADYLSDEDSSDNEQLSLAHALHNDKPPESAKAGLSALLAPSRKKSRLGEALTRDNDTASINSGKIGRPRSQRNRNPSISSTLNLRGSPRTHRYSMLSQNIPFLEYNSAQPGVKYVDSPMLLDGPGDFKEEVSENLIELDSVNTEHVRQMLRQLLLGFGVNNKSSWDKALMPIILRASHDVVQDVQAGDDIDIRHYIKLKKIPGGRTRDSAIYSGIVFTKNLALKSMARSILQPNVLILTFPLEYARHQRHFMSLEPVIRQEREYLQNLVHRISALKPNLLLVEKNVSGLALEYLEQAGISTAYNVRRSVLEAVSRVAQTRIITSIDKLAVKPAQAGKCGAFYLKTFMYQGRKKTCMYLTGCPKRLGCTIVLRGADEATLSIVKRITEFMVYVAYNLKLEAAFMRDEFAHTPIYSTKATILPDAEPTKKKTDTESSILEAIQHASILDSTDGASEVADNHHDNAADRNTVIDNDEGRVHDTDEIKLPDDTPMPTFYSDMMDRNRDTILSCSPCVRFMQPYLVVRAREQERRLMYLRSIRDAEIDLPPSDEKPSEFMLITPDMLQDTVRNAPAKIREVIRAVQDAQYDKAVHNYKTQKKQWEVYISGGQDMFTPFSHQNIAVLYSVVCASTSVPCKDPKVHAIRFYNEQDDEEGFERDIPLGQYIEARCMEAHGTCSENACDSKMLDHRHQYCHAQAQLSVTIEHHPPRLQGLQDIILMWSLCRVCGEETQITPMSENTWKYSWGKFLELAFWGHDLRPRAATCTHDLHKDHFRYFGFKNVAVRFQYDKIALLEIVVPRTRITWKVSNDLRFKNEVFLKAEERINKFMNSVKSRIKGIRIETILPEKTDSFKEEIQRLHALAEEHHMFLIEKLQQKYMGSKYFEIIPLNRAIRAMEEKSVEWDNIFQDFDQDFFPSEKDIRRLATLQLKKIFLDRDESTDSFSINEKTVATSMASSFMTGPSTPDDVSSMLSPDRITSKEAHEVMSSVVQDNLGSPKEGEALDIPGTANARMEEVNTMQSPGGTHDVEHLDLAVSPEALEKTVSEQNEIPLSGNAASATGGEGNEQLTEEPESLESAPTPTPSQEEAEPLVDNNSLAQVHDAPRRKSGFRSAIPLYRAHSQPANQRNGVQSSLSGPSTPMPTSVANNAISKRLGLKKSSPDESKHHQRRTSDKFGISAFKSSITQSMIPRSTLGRKKETKVSELAKHFEALSREFERERRRDKQKATKARQFRAFPSAAAVPIIEEFRNFHDAAEIERDSLEEPNPSNEAHRLTGGEEMAQQLTAVNHPPLSNDTLSDPISVEGAEDTADDTADDTAAETETEDQGEDAIHDDDQTPIAEVHKPMEQPSLDGESSVAGEEPLPSMQDSSELDFKIELPKYEKNSLMKLLTNFWAERSASGWSPLEYPLNSTDHVFADSDIIVREDEPSSLIAFVLGSDAYCAKLKGIESQHIDVQTPQHEKFVSDHFLTGQDQAHIERSLLQSTGTHFKYQFQEGSAKMMCKVFFVEQFEAVRRKCGIDSRFIESLSRCLKWDSKGGKTKSVFLKTLDDRLVLKSLSPIETQAFVKFAPSYFTLMGEALFHDLPSVIAKMVGFYQIVIKNPITGVEFNWFLLVMENLFYDRIPTRTFDLKGSMRNRRIQPTGEQNEVLLDENMVEYIFEKPLFAREHSKRLLAYSVFNDTLFLARQNVMDYSLMVAIDEDKKELVVGIIDCIRTYTWDKKLESWMKDRGKNRPTVTSPKEYKNRFRAAMDRYVLQAPTCWHQFNSRSNALRDTADDDKQVKDDLEDIY